MEGDLGVRLFDCAGEKVSLTRQGSVLLTYANEVAAVVSEASTLYRRLLEDTLALATSLTRVEVALMQQAILQNCRRSAPTANSGPAQTGEEMQ